MSTPQRPIGCHQIDYAPPSPWYHPTYRRRYDNAYTHPMATCPYKKQSLKPPNSCPPSRNPHYRPHSKYCRAHVCPLLPCQSSIYVSSLSPTSNNATSQPTSSPLQPPAIYPAIYPANKPTIAPSIPSISPSATKPSNPSFQQSALQPTPFPALPPTHTPAIEPITSPAQQQAVKPTNSPPTSPASQPAIKPIILPSHHSSIRPTS